MSDLRWTFEALVREVGKVLDRLRVILSDPASEPDRGVVLLRELGWNVGLASNRPGGDTALSSGLTALGSQLRDQQVTINDLISAVRSVLAAVDGLPDELGLDLDAAASSQLKAELPRRLLDYLVVDYLEQEHRALAGVLASMGVIRVRYETPTEPFRIGHFKREVRWDLLRTVFVDPSRYFEYAFGFGTQGYDGELVLDSLESLFRGVGITTGRFEPDEAMSIHPIAGEPLYAELFNSLELVIGVEIYRVADASGADTGLVLAPYVTGQLEAKMRLTDSASVIVDGNLELRRNVGVEIHREGPVNVFGIGDSDVPGFKLPDGDVRIRTRLRPEDGLVRFGRPDGTRLEVGGVGVGATVASLKGEIDLGVEVEVSPVRLVVRGDEGDGFLREILSGVSIDAEFATTIGFRNKHGLYVVGSGGFDLEIPIHRTIGGITVETLGIDASLDADQLPVRIGATLGAELGPIAVSVKRMGVTAALEFSESPDAESPVRMSVPAFLPPSGAGLSINLEGLVGGGFLEFDEVNQRYTGILTLTFGEIGLTAIGLIATRLPDGRDGYAMLINIGVQFQPPFELGLGFNLSGVGGVIGVNRSIDTLVVRRGIKAGTLDSILFPDPGSIVANAGKIISDMRAAFPPAEGQFVIGPMIKIGWGYPNVITANIGLFVAFPEPIVVLLLGQVKAALPEGNDAVIVINLDVAGALDVGREELWFRASLYDSRVLFITIFGDAAFFVSWGRQPQFALSIGGFYPGFTPPPPADIFGGMQRLGFLVRLEDFFRLRFECYLALTPNSLQFGAYIDLYISIAVATASGYLGFDVLFVFSPFSFETKVRGGVQLTALGVSLLDVDLLFMLSGPTPWHARGVAHVQILFIGIDVDFSITVGEGTAETLDMVDPWTPLQVALAAPENWASLLPSGRSMVESLRGLDDPAANQLVVHPAGRLEVRQNVVPLEIGLAKFGNAPIKGHDRFDIGDLTVNGESLKGEAVEEFFARGQYQDLPDEMKLNVPAFEKMKAGVTTTASEQFLVHGNPEAKPIAFESIMIKRDRTPQWADAAPGFGWEELKHIVELHIAGVTARRAGPRKRFATDPAAETKGGGTFYVANARNMARAELDPDLRANRRLTRYAAQQLLEAHLKRRGGKREDLIIVLEDPLPEVRVDVVEESYCIAEARDLSRAELVAELDGKNGGLTRMAADELLDAHLERCPEEVGELIVVPEYEVAA